MNLSLDPEAERELAEAANWYTVDSIRNAGRFMDAYEALVADIKSMPERFPRIRGEIRRARLKRYPYSIIFTWSEGNIWIAAIAHTKRRPGYWLERLPHY